MTDEFEIIAADTKPGLEEGLDPKTIMKLCYLIERYGDRIIHQAKNISLDKISISLNKDPLTLFISRKFGLLNHANHHVFFLENKMSVMLNKEIKLKEIDSFLSKIEEKYQINLTKIFEKRKKGLDTASIPKPQKFNFANLLPKKKERGRK